MMTIRDFFMIPSLLTPSLSLEGSSPNPSKQWGGDSEFLVSKQKKELGPFQFIPPNHKLIGSFWISCVRPFSPPNRGLLVVLDLGHRDRVVPKTTNIHKHFWVENPRQKKRQAPNLLSKHFWFIYLTRPCKTLLPVFGHPGQGDLRKRPRRIVGSPWPLPEPQTIRHSLQSWEALGTP